MSVYNRPFYLNHVQSWANNQSRSYLAGRGRGTRFQALTAPVAGKASGDQSLLTRAQQEIPTSVYPSLLQATGGVSGRHLCCRGQAGEKVCRVHHSGDGECSLQQEHQ